MNSMLVTEGVCFVGSPSTWYGLTGDIKGFSSNHINPMKVARQLQANRVAPAPAACACGKVHSNIFLAIAYPIIH